jgi:geranylgeranylglycerol-phosphate geranylgeranyltransferase
MCLQDWIKLTRAEHAFFVVFAIISSAAVSAKENSLQFDFLSAALASLGPFLITLAAFSYNDYLDYPSDKANKRFDRPLVSGKITKENALLFTVACVFFGLVLAYQFAGLFLFMTYVFATALSLSYSSFFKKKPLVGNAVIAFTMALPFAYGSLLSAQSVSYYPLAFSISAFFMGLGRELLSTLRDVEGDKKIGARTLPMLIGAKSTVATASKLLVASIALGILPLLKSFSAPYLLFYIITSALLAKAVVLSNKRVTTTSLNKCRTYTLWALLTGLLAFASLAV